MKFVDFKNVNVYHLVASLGCMQCILVNDSIISVLLLYLSKSTASFL